MKACHLLRPEYLEKVAPLVGAWIERHILAYLTENLIVAPLVGAWIESEKEEKMLLDLCVAPLVGAWIERDRS